MKNIRREKQERDAEEPIRLFKKQKACQKAKHVAAETEVTNKINEKQQERLDVGLEYVKASHEPGLETLEAVVKDLDRFIPPVANNTLKNAQKLVKANQALRDAITEGHECPNFDGFLRSMWGFKKKLTGKTAAIDRQVQGAKIASVNHNSKKRKPLYHWNFRRLGNKLRKWKTRYVVRGQPGCPMGA